MRVSLQLTSISVADWNYFSFDSQHPLLPLILHCSYPPPTSAPFCHHHFGFFQLLPPRPSSRPKNNTLAFTNIRTLPPPSRTLLSFLILDFQKERSLALGFIHLTFKHTPLSIHSPIQVFLSALLRLFTSY